MHGNVARGAALLDTINPNWWCEIDMPFLTMWSCSSCVLGQLFRNYHTGLFKLWSSTEKDSTLQALAVQHGFNIGRVDPHDGIAERTAAYHELRAEWLTLILARHAAVIEQELVHA